MTVVFTEETYGSVKKIGMAWTIGSSSSGTTTGTTSNGYNGALERLVTTPDGSAAPSANYDIVINDEDSTDVLLGGGANRSASTTEQVAAASLGIVANDKLTITITNAGSSCAGDAWLYIR